MRGAVILDEDTSEQRVSNKSRGTEVKAGSRLDASGRSVPRLLFIPAAFGVLFLLLPLVALFAKADWSSLPAAITSQQSRAGADAVAQMRNPGHGDLPDPRGADGHGAGPVRGPAG